MNKIKKYTDEKEKRKKENLIKRRNTQKEMIYRSRNQTDIGYTVLQRQHEQASIELSRSSILGKETLRQWCNNAYNYNSSKKRYEFDAGSACKPADLPQYIKI